MMLSRLFTSANNDRPRFGKAMIAAALLPLLSGCVAALIPLAAVGAMGKSQIDRGKAKRALISAGAVDLAPKTDVAPAVIAPQTSANVDFSEQGSGIDDPAAMIDPQSVLARFQRGSDAAGPQPFADFTRYALAAANNLAAGSGVESVVLVPQVALEKPRTIGCKSKPLAVLIDLDDAAHIDWAQDSQMSGQVGLAESLEALRAADISVIWLSSAPASTSAKFADLLKNAGLSAGDGKDYLFLNRGGADRKQEQRWDAARAYCIVAMAGDRRADFDELYDYLRHPDGAISLEHMFGRGWFLTPPLLLPAATDAPAQ
ncbi:MAG: hypothetical protein U5J78_07640 [Parasphingorhabdus sp.]|nr:hypothetical protein [Parasphingorhabdus sp.]